MAPGWRPAGPSRHRTPAPDLASPARVTAEPRNATVVYPGGLRARWRWAGSGSAAAVFALSETGGELIDLGTRVSPDPDLLCRAELRLEGPRGAWTARFASLISDEPRAVHWDTTGLLVVAYGFHTYGLDAGTGDPRWDHRSATPIVALLGSSRLAHVIVQAEIETFAIESDGAVAWRVAHSDVVTAAELIGGRLVLTSFDGQVTALDPATGRSSA
jgi:outer membrane protein assembly factor BamB